MRLHCHGDEAASFSALGSHLFPCLVQNCVQLSPPAAKRNVGTLPSGLHIVFGKDLQHRVASRFTKLSRSEPQPTFTLSQVPRRTGVMNPSIAFWAFVTICFAADEGVINDANDANIVALVAPTPTPDSVGAVFIGGLIILFIGFGGMMMKAATAPYGASEGQSEGRRDLEAPLVGYQEPAGNNAQYMLIAVPLLFAVFGAFMSAANTKSN